MDDSKSGAAAGSKPVPSVTSSSKPVVAVALSGYEPYTVTLPAGAVATAASPNAVTAAPAASVFANGGAAPAPTGTDPMSRVGAAISSGSGSGSGSGLSASISGDSEWAKTARSVVSEYERTAPTAGRGKPNPFESEYNRFAAKLKPILPVESTVPVPAPLTPAPAASPSVTNKKTASDKESKHAPTSIASAAGGGGGGGGGGGLLQMPLHEMLNIYMNDSRRGHVLLERLQFEMHGGSFLSHTTSHVHAT